MKSFHQILSEAPDVKHILSHQEKYWAHIHNEKEPELLSEHIGLVNSYAGKLVKAHGLDKIIDNLIEDYTKSWSNGMMSEFIKTFFAHSIVFHDFGKINENFQLKRMSNKSFKAKTYSSLNPDYGHSYLGAFIFLSYHISQILKTELSQSEKSILISNCFFFAYPILQHHSPALFNVIERDGLFIRFRDVLEELKPFLKDYQVELDDSILNSIFSNMEKIWFEIISPKFETEFFPLYALLKLNFSILTASDYLATHEYMNGNEQEDSTTTDFGVLENRERVIEICEHLKSYKYNAITYSELNNYQVNFPTERSNENLNFLRKQMSIEVVNQIRKNSDGNLFYLEAPTGAGKTNLSALVLGELLNANPALNKVFYVFPFTTLITQTYGVLKESLGLKEGEIVELHSKAQLTSKTEQNEDGVYGDEKRDFIDNLFALYPFTLLSHVKFFDILKTNSKEENYLLHRLANSVVIIDEIQSYNPAIWDKMLLFIEQYAKYFNMKFILMSATLPKISNLNIGFKNKVEFIDLLPNAKEYLTNINFSGRVQFNLDLLQREELELEELKNIVLDKSEEYAETKGSVKTIVEFIYKKSATAFQRLFEEDDFFEEIFVLSGTILEPRRKEVINYLKRNKNTQKNILLITTQVVEAGVDIDMDLGFKNTSLLDSDEQLAGRVNRNANKNTSDVYLFNIDDAKVLYGKDYRFKKTAEMNIEDRANILKNKDFKTLYEKVLLNIDDTNNPVFADSILSYQKDMKDLRYSDIDKGFQIINQSNNSIFIPLNIPVEIAGIQENQLDEIFSNDELHFLSVFEISPIYDEKLGKNVISGIEIWSLYISFIENDSRKKGFDLQNKIDFKKLQTIMSKFCFSLISHSKDYRELQNGFGVEEYGYFYFDHYDEIRENGKIYDYKTGLNPDAFSDSNFI